MIVKLYPGTDTDLQLRLFDSIKQIDSYAALNTDSTGCYVAIDTRRTLTEEVAENVCTLVFDFFLEEAVLLKLYDEYTLSDSKKASGILKQICEMFSESAISDKIKYYIENHGQINIESFVLFNIKNIMSTAYRLADICYMDYAYHAETLAIADLISSYKALGTVDAEFGTDTSQMGENPSGQ